MKMPDSPPMTNIETNASAFSIGVVKWMLPPHSVPSQLNVLMAEGTAIIIVETMKRRAEDRVHAALEHVVAPDDEAEAGDAARSRRPSAR